jgi:Flp pilus assembly protein TadD
MFSSRNIHLAILGIILGASAGYIAAFYKANASLTPPPITSDQAQTGMPAGHPDVNDEQLLDAMKKAVEADSSNPEIVKRYAMALFDASHFDEAAQWFKKAAELEPNNVETRSMYGAVLWRMGQKNEAEVQLQAAVKLDPRNVASLHGLSLLALEKHDLTRAGQLIKQIETVDPNYSQLSELRARLQAERGGK